MDDLLADLKHGLRLLLRDPRYTAVSVLTLTLGIGTTTAVFSIATAVLLRPLPYGDSQRLVTVSNRFAIGLTLPLSQPEYTDYRREARSLDAVAGYSPSNWSLTGTHPAERIEGAFVSPNLFPLLEGRAELGRTFLPAEETPGRDKVAILTHATWRDRFGSDSGIIGHPLLLDASQYVIVGVMPEGFQIPSDLQAAQPSQVWVPLSLDPSLNQRRNLRFINVLGHVRPGATPETAREEAAGIASGFRQIYPQNYPKTGHSLGVTSLREELVGGMRPVLALLVGGVSALLLITCVNLATLQSARAHTRRGEFALRAALGAGRARLARQLLTESLVLACAGGIGGVVLARIGVRAILALQPVPGIRGSAGDTRLVIVAAAVSMVTAVLFGFLPARQGWRAGLIEVLKVGQRGSAGRRAHRVLTVAEVALAVVLVVGASLLSRSLWNLVQVDPGIRPDHVVTLSTSVPAAADKAEQIAARFDQMLGALERLPGVTSAGLTDDVPLSGTQNAWTFFVEGRPVEPGTEGGSGDTRVISARFFLTMGIPLIRGRDFTDLDRAGSPFVAIVSNRTAQTYWPNEDPIGQRIRLFGMPEDRWITIVGIVGDVRNSRLDAIRRGVYLPFLQFPALTAANPALQRNSMIFALRTAADPAAIAKSAASVIASVDPDVPVYRIRSADAIISGALAPARFRTVLVTMFAVLGLLVAGVGVYGVIAYAVSQRTIELGIRMALGAQRFDVLRMILREGLVETAAGVTLGVVAALALAPMLASFLFGVTVRDPVIFLAVPLLLAVVSLAAAYVPARRAARVDPVQALRPE